MGMRVTTNISAINAQRNLQQSQRVVGKSMSQLASGSRINIAADDAAGLAISDQCPQGQGTVRVRELEWFSH